jgi:hypothetical protein
METQEFMASYTQYVQEHGINIIIAIGVLILGWVVLSLMAYILRRHILSAMKINYFFESIAFKLNVEKILARVLFFIGLIFLFKISAQLANLTEIDNFFDNVLAVAGHLIYLVARAMSPLIFALIAASVTRKGILFFGAKFKLDERIGSKLDAGEAVSFSFTKSLSEMGYGIVFLVFLPAILSGLGLQDMSQPILVMVENALSFMPKLFGAAIVLGVGWFVAKIIKEVVTGLLLSIGADSALMRMQMDQVTGGIKFSKLGGTLAYAVVLILVFVEALKKLSLDSITEPIIAILNQFFSAVPSLLYAAFLITVTYFIASVVRQIFAQVLEGLGFNNILTKLGFEASYSKATPSQIAGLLAFYGLMFFAIIEALNQLGLTSISEIVRDVTVFAGQVLFGLVIFGIGLFVANIVTQTIKSSSAPNSNLLAFLARTGILILVGAMALKRMGLADEIVNIAFGLILGSLALGAGIAFGLGGKDEAAEIVRQIRSKFKA